MTTTSPPPTTSTDTLKYQVGFGNEFESEALEGALIKGRNNPKNVPLGLYTEQLSGTAFTRPRHVNQRTWLYRQQPPVIHNIHKFQSTRMYFGQEDPTVGILDPNPLRWQPFLENDNLVRDKDFVSGMHLLGASGDSSTKNGLAIYIYLAGTSMHNRHLYNSDGDFLILPQQGTLDITTELGKLQVTPGEFCVIPRGIVFQVHLNPSNGNGGNDNAGPPGLARGYVLEIYKGHFSLPELGPIGSNGLANARDFQYPVAWYEPAPAPQQETSTPTVSTLFNKFGSQLWSKPIATSPYNVVAWHGNYLPFKYHLANFCAVNSVTFDHLDPSIYTVLTVTGDEPGTALVDFVIFPPRWMSTDANTFRPPWFHRNTMTEFMGLLYGNYDAKTTAFAPGGASLHSCMTPHGPDSSSYLKNVAAPCDKPTKLEGGLAFMFETSCLLKLSNFALHNPGLEDTYGECWKDLPNEFVKNMAAASVVSSSSLTSPEQET
jgi:homogentisate 1,2-dioxygenase